MARLKIVEQFDRDFTLESEPRAELFNLLSSASFRQQVSAQAQCEDVAFTELLFQPVPYTQKETRGMPLEYEKYHDSPDYIIINVPPNFMFKAKIFKPNRLCAIYRKVNA